MEPLILYFVLFFPGVFASSVPPDASAAGTIAFSVIRELGRTLTYTIPSLALLWYLISLSTSQEDVSGILKKLKKTDLLSFIFGIPGLILIGFAVSFLISLLSHNKGLAPPLKVEAPQDIIGWVVMIIACLGTGYLEESYFRHYLLTKLKNQFPNSIARIAISTILFSVCHIYEGPWGIINAFLAGLLLSMLYTRHKSLHGIAWAHGAYNIFVYTMGIYNS